MKWRESTLESQADCLLVEWVVANNLLNMGFSSIKLRLGIIYLPALNVCCGNTHIHICAINLKCPNIYYYINYLIYIYI